MESDTPGKSRATIYLHKMEAPLTARLSAPSSKSLFLTNFSIILLSLNENMTDVITDVYFSQLLSITQLSSVQINLHVCRRNDTS